MLTFYLFAYYGKVKFAPLGIYMKKRVHIQFLESIEDYSQDCPCDLDGHVAHILLKIFKKFLSNQMAHVIKTWYIKHRVLPSAVQMQTC